MILFGSGSVIAALCSPCKCFPASSRYPPAKGLVQIAAGAWGCSLPTSFPLRSVWASSPPQSVPFSPGHLFQFTPLPPPAPQPSGAPGPRRRWQVQLTPVEGAGSRGLAPAGAGARVLNALAVCAWPGASTAVPAFASPSSPDLGRLGSSPGTAMGCNLSSDLNLSASTFQPPGPAAQRDSGVRGACLNVWYGTKGTRCRVCVCARLLGADALSWGGFEQSDSRGRWVCAAAPRRGERSVAEAFLNPLSS